MNASGIYQIKNLVSGKVYVGSAVNFRKRFYAHKYELRNNKHHSQKLQRSWDKHGEKLFSFDRLEIVADKNDLIQREQYWIDLCDSYKNGYNCNPTAGSCLGRVASEETLVKMRLAGKLGRKRIFSEDEKARVREIHTGSKRSEESRARMSAAQKGKVFSDEARAKMSATRLNMSDETKTRMSIAQKGRKHSEETRAKMALSAKGRTHSSESKSKMSEIAKNRSDETRARMSASQKRVPRICGRNHSEEAKAKMSASQKERWAKIKSN